MTEPRLPGMVSKLITHQNGVRDHEQYFTDLNQLCSSGSHIISLVPGLPGHHLITRYMQSRDSIPFNPGSKITNKHAKDYENISRAVDNFAKTAMWILSTEVSDIK